ncbi:MAG: M28 family metallopeptidase [Chloracidobacterium sp.]|nr:M28 family metallopeptidase [Chloracidobacterium sp.]MDW8216024.1 M28 family metallopeptidase [Acidobacteriota bacterium]
MTPHSVAAETKTNLSALESQLLAAPSPDRARQTLRTLTAKPHLAGTPEDYATALYVRDELAKAGFQTELVEYEVYLPRPKSRRVEMTAPTKYRCTLTEPVLADDPDSASPLAVPTFAAWSPSGKVEAPVVYANYGLPRDYEILDQLGVSVRGKIVIVRYGEAYRGVKAQVAQQRGAAGLLVYSDPKDDGYVQGKTYPDGPWRADNCVQRGSYRAFTQPPGDPLTPGRPAKKGVPRLNPKDAGLPTIPIQPLSYRDALPILESLRGPDAPKAWVGGLPIAYRIGGGETRVRIALEMDYRLRTIWNVIGTLPGTEFPDEWILLGNHRDAWVYGAVDPSSGTTAMLEVARAFGELVKQGWKPRRTIKLCSWDAEEYGLIGSTEWVEEHLTELREKAVCYLNVDSAVSGDNFRASAVPSLWAVTKAVLRDAPDASGTRSLYDNWRAQDKNAPEVRFGKLGSGSDYAPFLQLAGVACLDMASTGGYGVYHSTYDSFRWMEKFGDPNFTRHTAMARGWALLAFRLSESVRLELNLLDYAREIERLAQELAQEHPTLDAAALLDAARDLVIAAEMFETEPDTKATLAARNRLRRRFEGFLLTPEGLPKRYDARHVIYAPGVFSGYGAEVFSGVRYALARNDPEDTARAMVQVVTALHQAAQALHGRRTE